MWTFCKILAVVIGCIWGWNSYGDRNSIFNKASDAIFAGVFIKILK